MIHEVLPVGVLQCNCSIFGDEESREAIVVDPGDDIAQIEQVLAQHRLKVKAIVITHAHIDHIGGAAKLKKSTGASVYMNEADQELYDHLDVQASWVGMRNPERTTIDTAAADADRNPDRYCSARSLYETDNGDGCDRQIDDSAPQLGETGKPCPAGEQSNAAKDEHAGEVERERRAEICGAQHECLPGDRPTRIEELREERCVEDKSCRIAECDRQLIDDRHASTGRSCAARCTAT